MKKNVVNLLAAGAVVLGMTAATAPAADAAPSKGCVTQKEFAKVKKGYSVAKVARVFGTKGKRDAISVGGGYRFEIRSYKTCVRFGAVAIGFENGKLSNKTGIF